MAQVLRECGEIGRFRLECAKMLQQRKTKSTRRSGQADNRWFAPAVLTCGLGTAAAAITLASGLTWPSVAAPLSLAAQHEQRADQALNIEARSEPDLGRASLENDRTLASSPSTASAWLRAAYIRQQMSGSLGPESLRDLETSYRVAPLGPGVTRWRLRFVFENWQSVNPRIRSAALNELRVFASYHSGSGDLVDSIENPAGRLAAKLTVRKVYMTIAAVQSSKTSTGEPSRLSAT
jgi:hypothetical protein